MNPNWPDHALSEEERAAFARDGYLVVEQALDGDRLERLREIAEQHDAAFRARAGVTEFDVLNEHDLVGQEPEWLDMIDLARTFPKVFGIMGWNIQLFHTQLLVTPRSAGGTAPGPYGWHQDNNRMNRDLDTEQHPMISLKVGYFLSALPGSGMGNLCVIPGSHRLPITQPADHSAGSPAGSFRGSAVGPPPGAGAAVELLAEAGDAVIFDRRLWHSASTNASSSARVFVTYGYSYRWLRPKSQMAVDQYFDKVDPIRRQLLGWSTNANGYFDPLPEDVPLREYTNLR